MIGVPNTILKIVWMRKLNSPASCLPSQLFLPTQHHRQLHSSLQTIERFSGWDSLQINREDWWVGKPTNQWRGLVGGAAYKSMDSKANTSWLEKWEPPPTNPPHYIMQQNGQLQRWNPSSWALLIKYSLHKCTIDLIILCID